MLTLLCQQQGTHAVSSATRFQYLEALPLPVVIARLADAQIVYANAHFGTLCGMPVEQITGGQTLACFIGQVTQRALFERLATHDHVSNYEIHTHKTDGTPLWLMASMQRMPLDDDEVAFASFYNLTNIKRTEENLWRMHQRILQLLGAAPSLMIGVDADMKVEWWNPSAKRLLRILPLEVLSQSLATCPLPWEAHTVLTALTTCRDTGQPVRVENVRFQRPDGKDGLLGLTINPVEDASGFLILGTDITERRLLEQQLAQAQKLEGIWHLAAGIAHEINTPIQFIGDNLSFLQDAFQELSTLLELYHTVWQAHNAGTVSASLSHQIHTAAASIDRAYLTTEIPAAIRQSLEGTERVAKLVGAMKEFSHPSNGTMTAINLHQAIENTILVARNEWKYVANIVTDFDPALPLVPCFPMEFNQVILNLIVNAAHAIEEVLDGQSAAKGTITVQTRRQEDWVAMRVSDTGVGIPAVIQDKVFDP